jgi:hypothetical protein
VRYDGSDLFGVDPKYKYCFMGCFWRRFLKR